MAFSGALTITDLDDFLTPSQACIIPVRGAKTEDIGPTEIHIDADNKYYEVSTYPDAGAGPSGSSKALEKAEINLNDCLACSGCITSTESMLITLQSHKEVLDFIAASTHSHEACTTEHQHTTRTPILSISPQTLASLSAHYSATTGRPTIPLRTLLRRIRRFLGQPSRGGWRVWDTTFARHIALRQTVTEFEERKAYRDKGKAPDRGPGVPPPGPLPVLASACPGWVCYAEKAQGDMLPMMSATRSPQGIMGALAKNWFGGRMDITPNLIYHVTAMPCYDKKLEASRSDYYNSVHSTRDVDCVLTTGELDLLLSDLGFEPHQPVDGEEGEASRDVRDVGCSPWPEMLNHPGSSSGSYLGNLMSSLSERHINPTRIVTREIRGSSDNVEYSLEDTVTGEIIFKGAKCYGFRNLQNLVRKVGKETGLAKGARGGGASKLSAAIAARRRKAKTASASAASTPGTPIDSDAEAVAGPTREEKKLDFVEVMACPGGCVNGGGQMKPAAAQVLRPNGTNGANGTADPVALGMEVDEEGYPRPMQDDGVEAAPALTSAPPAVSGTEEGMRWSTKEWVNKVEAIYWNGLPTPPPSPSIGPKGLVGETQPNGHGLTSNGAKESDRIAEADRLAEEIIAEATGADAAARWEMLNTRFRKVEGDILQGGVTHEAVVW